MGRWTLSGTRGELTEILLSLETILLEVKSMSSQITALDNAITTLTTTVSQVGALVQTLQQEVTQNIDVTPETQRIVDLTNQLAALVPPPAPSPPAASSETAPGEQPAVAVPA